MALLKQKDKAGEAGVQKQKTLNDLLIMCRRKVLKPTSDNKPN